MSKFMVNLTAINPKDEHRCTPPVEVMVDTGTHSSWLPRQLLQDAGIKPVEKVQFEIADKRLIERDVKALLRGHADGEIVIKNETPPRQVRRPRSR